MFLSAVSLVTSGKVRKTWRTRFSRVWHFERQVRGDYVTQFLYSGLSESGASGVVVLGPVLHWPLILRV
jgi:hypothetical protein